MQHTKVAELIKLVGIVARGGIEPGPRMPDSNSTLSFKTTFHMIL